jgi:hypothetical protein
MKNINLERKTDIMLLRNRAQPTISQPNLNMNSDSLSLLYRRNFTFISPLTLPVYFLSNLNKEESHAEAQWRKVRGVRQEKHSVAVSMNKVFTAWRTEKAVKTKKCAKALA